jgi:hypothetical protein
MLGEHNQYRQGLLQIDRAELDRTHRTGRAFRQDRWTPAWALDDKKVRLVVYTVVFNYVTHALGHRHQLQPGISLIELEKLARTVVREKIMKRVERSNGGTRKNFEEHLRTSQNGIAARATTLIYKAYRERLKGPDIAEVLEMTPVSVREILFRLNKIARTLFPESDCSKPHWSTKPESELKKKRQSHARANLVATEQLKSLAEQFNASVSLKELSRQSGIPTATIWWQINASGLRDPKRKRRLVKIDDTLKLIAAKYNAGTTLKNLSKEFGIHEGTIRWRLRTYELQSADRPRTNLSHFKKKISVTPELLDLAERRKNGALYSELAAISGMKQMAVRHRLVSLGLV